MMEEYTPANSVYDEEDMVERGIDRSRLRLVLRAINAVLHLAACQVLLAIMATFLARNGNFYPRMT